MCYANAAEKEIDRGQTILIVSPGKGGAFRGIKGDSYRMFLGLMTKHQRVQIAPVAVRARFWVRERLSAGREKSLTPARTMDHWVKSMAVVS